MSSHAETVPVGPERRLSLSIRKLLEKHRLIAEALLYLAVGFGAWMTRFFPDDAFIGYRYAKNFASGLGLVYNPGEQVEGYTNFLWTLLHALPYRLGIDPILFSSVVGVAISIAVVAVTLRLSDKVLSSKPLAYLACLVLAANATFLGYAAGGMETMLQALLVLVFIWLLLPLRDGRVAVREVSAGLVASLAVMTRMDSVLLVGVIALGYWVLSYKKGSGPMTLARSFLLLALPFSVMVFPWLAWKLSYYGSILPNTLAAKTGGGWFAALAYGIFYSACFFLSYGAFLLIPRLLRFGREFFLLSTAKVAFAAVGVWIVYICLVGGDFMEFRFFVPIMPFLAMLAAFLLDRYHSIWKQVALIIIMLGFSSVHLAVRNPTPYPYPVWTFQELNLCRGGVPISGWHSLGRLLADNFPGGLVVPGQPKIAVMPAGALPYESGLPVVDMLGINDPWIAKNGDPFGSYYPGHLRMAPVNYLVEQEVSLVFGLPLSVSAELGRKSYRLSELAMFYFVADLNLLPETAQVVEITHSTDRNWLAIYLVGNAKVDEAIRKNGWRVLKIERKCDLSDLDPFVRLVGTKTCLAENQTQ